MSKYQRENIARPRWSWLCAGQGKARCPKSAAGDQLLPLPLPMCTHVPGYLIRRLRSVGTALVKTKTLIITVMKNILACIYRLSASFLHKKSFFR